MSTNRVVTAEPFTTAAAPSTDGRRPLRIVGALLTVALLAPSAALLASRVRGLLALEDGSAPACEGAAVVGRVLQLGLPTVFLLLAIPGALLSLGHRAQGWVWLLLVLVGTAGLEVALRVWLPGCL